MAKFALPFQDSVRPKASADETALRTIHILGFLFLAVALALPLGSLLLRAFEDHTGSRGPACRASGSSDR